LSNNVVTRMGQSPLGAARSRLLRSKKRSRERGHARRGEGQRIGTKIIYSVSQGISRQKKKNHLSKQDNSGSPYIWDSESRAAGKLPSARRSRIRGGNNELRVHGACSSPLSQTQLRVSFAATKRKRRPAANGSWALPMNEGGSAQ